MNAIVQVYRDGEDVFEITEKDYDELKLPTAKNFIPIAVVLKSDMVSLFTQSQKQYFLIPDGYESGLKYAALMKALIKSKQCIVGKYSIRSGREFLAIIMPDNNGLILLQIPFNDARRSAPKLVLPLVSNNVCADMKTILDTLPQTFDYAATIDSYDTALEKLILVKTATNLAATASSKTKTNGKSKKSVPQVIDKITELNNAVAALKLNIDKPKTGTTTKQPRQRKNLLTELAKSTK